MIRVLLAFALGLITGALLVVILVFGLAISVINEEEKQEEKENYYGEQG